MKAKWMVALVAASALLAAVAAHAADTAKQSPAAQGQSGAARMDSPAGGPGDMGPGSEGDDDDLMAFGDEDGPGDGPGDGMGHMGHMGGMGGMGGMGRGPGMRRGGMGRAFAMLNLTDDQKTKLKAVHDRQQRKDVQSRADLQIARMDLRDLVSAEKPNTSAINAQIDKVSRMRAEQSKARVGSLLEARAVLTPEQQKQLREMRFKGPGEGRGMHGGPGQKGPPDKPGDGM